MLCLRLDRLGLKCHCLGNCSMLFLSPTVNPNTCSSTGSESLDQFFKRKVTTLQAGSPCNDFKGYCDVFMKCRLVDADGPLARLKKAIFNPKLYENIAEWIVASVLTFFFFWNVIIQTGFKTPKTSLLYQTGIIALYSTYQDGK